MELKPGVYRYTFCRSLRRLSLLLVFVSGCMCQAMAKQKGKVQLAGPALVASFYKQWNNKMFWFSGTTDGLILRAHFIALLSQCETQGLDIRRYPVEALTGHLRDWDTVSTKLMDAEYLYTDVALQYLADVLKGSPDRGAHAYDELSPQAEAGDNRTIISALAGCRDTASMSARIAMMEPRTQPYLALKAALRNALQGHSADTIQQLGIALNTYRRIHHSHYPKCIAVNIPAAKLYYFEHDSLVLEMKVVVGKPSTPTPVFTAYGNQVILYPYWNVPHSIAVNELLPLCKKGAGALRFMNMQVLDSKGRLVDPVKINWKSYNRNNFPFRFRQSTGCDNALGVVKINLTSPYSVYLHDTNLKFAFQSNRRFQSHGCIRIEKPFELCGYLLGTNFDEQFVTSCIRDQMPVVKQLPDPVPVFVTYTRAVAEDGQVTIYPDTYHWSAGQ